MDYKKYLHRTLWKMIDEGMERRGPAVSADVVNEGVGIGVTLVNRMVLTPLFLPVAVVGEEGVGLGRCVLHLGQAETVGVWEQVAVERGAADNKYFPVRAAGHQELIPRGEALAAGLLANVPRGVHAEKAPPAVDFLGMAKRYLCGGCLAKRCKRQSKECLVHSRISCLVILRAKIRHYFYIPPKKRLKNLYNSYFFFLLDILRFGN